MKKWIALLLLAALLCPALGCGRAAEEITLWVVTEQTTWDRMNGQTQVVIDAFEKANSGVKIRLDTLPTNKQERSAYLQKLRTQITQGRGPDAYLLPTGQQLTIRDGGKFAFPTVEPLFSDVTLAMENGLFRDLSQLYDADTELGKENFNTAIMEAGLLNGSRYVLPLRYDIPVIYAQTQVLQNLGFDLTALQKPLPLLMQTALTTGNPLIAAGGVYEGSSAFANWIDYTSAQVTLPEDALTSYFETTRKLLALSENGPAVRMDVSSYIHGMYDMGDLSDPRYPLFIGTLARLFDYAAVAQYENSDYAILPLQAEGGGTVATVTYYAAMGTGCKNPELTYAFLRQFLLEDSQWERNRPTKMNILVGDPPSKFTQDQSQQSQVPGLLEEGWPVRSVGSLNELWTVRIKQFYIANYIGQYKTRMRKIALTDLEERWTQILETPIAQVRFPSAMDAELANALNSLNDSMQGYTPTDLSAQSVAKDFLWTMRRHISEG